MWFMCDLNQCVSTNGMYNKGNKSKITEEERTEQIHVKVIGKPDAYASHLGMVIIGVSKR